MTDTPLTHLEKAQSALTAAADLASALDSLEQGNGSPSRVEHERHLARLMDIAAVQAAVATADALTRIANQHTDLGPR